MRAECPYCHKVKIGMMVAGGFCCDDCLNRPERTRPRSETLPSFPLPGHVSASKTEGPKVALNKLVIRDDDEEGPVVIPPSDGNLHDVPESEIERAKQEHANDAREFQPTNPKTLQRIGETVQQVGSAVMAAMVGEELAGSADKKTESAGAVAPGTEAAKATKQSAKRSSRSVKRPDSRVAASGRSHKAR